MQSLDPLLPLLSYSFNDIIRVGGVDINAPIHFKNMDATRMKRIMKTQLDRFISEYNKQSFSNIDDHFQDEDGEILIVDYSTANAIEADMNYEKSNFHLLFKVIPSPVTIPTIRNNYRIELMSRFDIPQWKIIRQILNTIENKRQQHNASSFTNKIYFLDSESIPDMNLPILQVDGMFEEEKIKKYIDEKFSVHEIVCFVKRDYKGAIPRISIKAFGKDIDEEIKQRFENLKTTFDYQISYQ